MTDAPLTEADYEERFKTRYTDEDKEFTEYTNQPPPTPPIFERWVPRK